MKDTSWILVLIGLGEDMMITGNIFILTGFCFNLSTWNKKIIIK